MSGQFVACFSLLSDPDIVVRTGARPVYGFVPSFVLGCTNTMMAIPNLIALVILSPIVFSIIREFFDTRGNS